MKDVLDEIVAHKRVELEHLKQAVPPAMLYNEVEKVAGHRSFHESGTDGVGKWHHCGVQAQIAVERMDHGAGQGRGYSF